MRSETSKTSAMLWLMSTTPRPCSARRRTRSSTWRVCATPSAAVGSSSSTTLEFQSTALAIATVWRWPPESDATGIRTEVTVRTDSDARVRAGGLLHVGLVEQPGLAALAAEEHVLDDVEVVGQREVLVDDLDAERRGVGRAVDRDRLALEEDLAAVDRVDARHALDQRRLAGAVVADEGGDLAGTHREVDLVQHLHRAEALVDPAQLQSIGSGHGVITCLVVACADARPGAAPCRAPWP